MALDFKAIRTTVIETIQLAIGPLLSQQFNPVLQQSYGTVFNARPNPELPVPTYPYAVVDITSSEDTDWFLTNLVHDLSTDKWQWETHKTVSLQISIFGGDAIQIGETLKTAYRRDDVLEILINGDIALADVQTTQILPELIQTDWLEVSFITLTIRVNDIFIDQNLQSVEAVILDGELTGSLTSDPLKIHIDTTGFIWTINTELPGSSSDSYELPLTSSAGYDARVYWGDGSFDDITGTDPILHQYAIVGIYDIQIVGFVPELIFNADITTDFAKITEIKQWGGNQWINVKEMFNGCVNLTTVSAPDTPNLSAATSMFRMFRTCDSLTGGVAFKDWDTSNITVMQTCFSQLAGSNVFNTDLTNWDTSNVDDFFGMFANCNFFNGDISNWDISAGTDFEFMFFRCDVFNSDVSAWQPLSGITLRSMFNGCASFNADVSIWPMSNVQRIENIFFGCTVFNQPIGIWDLSSVVDNGQNNYVDSLLEECLLFNQDLSNWPFVQWATFHDALTNSPSFNQDVSTWDLSNMGSGADQGLENTFNGTAMSTANYDLALDAWANETFHSTPTGMFLGMSSTQYSVAQQANRDILTTTFGWVITDAGSV